MSACKFIPIHVYSLGSASGDVSRWKLSLKGGSALNFGLLVVCSPLNTQSRFGCVSAWMFVRLETYTFGTAFFSYFFLEVCAIIFHFRIIIIRSSIQGHLSFSSVILDKNVTSVLDEAVEDNAQASYIRTEQLRFLYVGTKH